MGPKIEQKDKKDKKVSDICAGLKTARIFTSLGRPYGTYSVIS